MVKCEMCPKKSLANEMKYFPIINKTNKYICSDECYEKYKQEWLKNER